MEVVGALRGALVWLGGGLAALTAICYGAGYFLFHAHLNMLGLAGVVDLPHDRMLIEGGNFFLTVVPTLLEDSFAVAVAGVIVYVAVAVCREIAPLARGIGRWTGAMRQATAGIAARHPRWQTTAALALLLTGLVWHSSYYLELRSLGGVYSTLYAAPPPAGCPAIDGKTPNLTAAVSINIVGGHPCRSVLIGRFAEYIHAYFALLLVVTLAFGRPGTSLEARAVRATLGLYAIAFTLSLPVGYGVLVRAPIYPHIAVTLKDGSLAAGYLLARTDTTLLVWLPDSARATWYPVVTIGAITVDGEGNLFDQFGRAR